MTNYEFASGMLKDFGDVTEEYLESYYGMKGIFDVKDDWTYVNSLDIKKWS